MTKLTNNVKYQNNTLPPAFAEYLISNKFECAIALDETLEFRRKGIKVWVKDDTIILYNNQGETTHCVTNIRKMSLFKWIMLMHILEVQTIAGFLRNSHEEATASDLPVQIEKIFKPFHSFQY